MGKRTIKVKKQVAESIASIALFVESKGLPKTAELFSEAVYDFIEDLADDRRIYPLCKDEARKAVGLKCISYRKKYSIAFIETATRLTIVEFKPAKLIR